MTVSDKRKEDQRKASQALRDKKKVTTDQLGLTADKLSQVAQGIEESVANLDKLINKLRAD